MRILAIESSCDETAAAIVEDGWKVLSNVIASSVDLHKLTGGVVPEIAARAHVESIIPVVDEAMRIAFAKDQGPLANDKSQITSSKQTPNSKFQVNTEWIGRIDAIAVTKEPGLVTSLLVGNETAKYLGFAWNKPVIEVNHIHGHMYANWLGGNGEMQTKNEKRNISFPAIILTVSGGHNELVLMRGHGDFEVIGESIDDAAGEAFDKVARVIGLGFPGGPAIQAVAAQVKSENAKVKSPLLFPRAWLSENGSPKWDEKNFNFSFSGLKSEVLREVQKRKTQNVKNKNELNDQDQFEIAVAFQEAVCDVLSEKLVLAASRFGAKEVHLAGGVSANKRLREMVQDKLKLQPSFARNELRMSENEKCKSGTAFSPTFRVPEQMSYCTDNAAMIGAAAFWMQG